MSFEEKIREIDEKTFNEIMEHGFLLALDKGICFNINTQMGFTPAFIRQILRAGRSLKLELKGVEEPRELTFYRLAVKALEFYGDGRLSFDEKEKLIPLVYSLISLNTLKDVSI